MKIKRKLEKAKGKAREPRLNSFEILRKVIGEVTSIERQGLMGELKT